MVRVSGAYKERLRKIFVGTQGVRAGWSILIFAALLIPGVFIAKFLMQDHSAPSTDEITLGSAFTLEAAQLVFIVGATVITGRIEGRAVWSYYGLAGRRPLVKFLTGWVGGLLCLSLVVGTLYAGGYLLFDGQILHGLPALGYGLVWSLIFMMVAIREEVLFRGYLQATLTRAIGFWPAAIMLSLLFGAGHLQNDGETITGIVGVILHGLLYCFLLRISGSLWLGIGFHMTWDWAQSYLYGTPQSGHMMQGHLFMAHATGNPLMSGGGTGPEGSLLSGPPQLLGLLVLFWAARRAGLFERGNMTMETIGR
jgi:membrane protease YdiL (CAAX protease family)